VNAGAFDFVADRCSRQRIISHRASKTKGRSMLTIRALQGVQTVQVVQAGLTPRVWTDL
jgi:hypothetical protein